MATKIIDVVGESKDSWEDALRNAVEEAPDLPVFRQKNKISRISVKSLDVRVEDNKIAGFLCRAEIFLD